MDVYLFPGQGSQVKGMGKNVFNDYSEYIEQANQILGYDVKDLCLNDPKNQLGHMEYAQPALYVVSSLSYLKLLGDVGIPNYLAGHSLGEYSALFAAGCFDFATGLRLVAKRGELMGLTKNGGMLTIMGLHIDEVRELLMSYQLDEVDIANHNTPDQVVISGLLADMQKASAIFSKRARLCIPLHSSGAFHSRHMVLAKLRFALHIKAISFQEPKIKVIANLDGKPYETHKIANNLINQMTGSICWVKSMCYLIDQGVIGFRQVAPGNSLMAMVRRVQREYPSPLALLPVI